MPPLWQFSVSCRIPTHWKLRNTEEAQKGYSFEIKRTSDGDAANGDYSVALPPRENRPFFPVDVGGGCRNKGVATERSLFGLSAVPALGFRAWRQFFRDFFAVPLCPRRETGRQVVPPG